ncbi:MAG: DUF192 domain-containing protein [Patescibacteria group bacterium]|nr:DUF192 domain-containing protein [Patescibacteria group bacterium]
MAKITVEFLTKKGRVKISAEVVNTVKEKNRGLMFCKKLEFDSGMLFIYKGDEDSGFWMKNTYIPLDAIFLDADKKIVAILHMNPAENPEEGPWPVYKPDVPYRYAIEVNAGFVKENEIRVGDKTNFVH